MMKEKDNLDGISSILSPRSIAVVGASEGGGYPTVVLENLKKYNYSGKIFPINPKRDQVQGIKSYPDITSIPQDVDLAVIIISRSRVLNVLQECKNKGVKGAIIITSGFHEADEEGKKLDIKMRELIKETGIRVVGPNCAGLANFNHDTVLTLLEHEPLKGNVSFISQSGALMMAIYGMLIDKEIGLNHIVSTGNQMDLQVTDFIDYTLQDKYTDVVATFIEGISDGAKFLRVADRALEKGKPIIALKIGKTERGMEAARTHTGSMVGSDKVFDAAFRQKGIMRVRDLNELVDLTKVFSVLSKRSPGRGRIGIISQSGGMASLTADLASEAGIEIPSFTDETIARLINMKHLLTFGYIANPADVRGAGTSPGTLLKTAEPILEDRNIDIVVMLLARSAVGERDIATAEELKEVWKKTDKPVFVVWPGRRVPDANADYDSLPFRIMEKGRMPFFDSSSTCISAIGRFINYHQFRQQFC